MSASPEKALRLTFLPFLFVMASTVASLFIVPLIIGIWLPDVFIDRQHTLAHERLASGHSLRVIQYWNHCDFYNTELVHTAPDGSTEAHVLDGDDSKSWRVPLVVDERHRVAIVTLGGGRVRKVNW